MQRVSWLSLTWSISISHVSEVIFPAEKFIQFCQWQLTPGLFGGSGGGSVRSSAHVFEKISYSKSAVYVNLLYTHNSPYNVIREKIQNLTP